MEEILVEYEERSETYSEEEEEKEEDFYDKGLVTTIQPKFKISQKDSDQLESF